MKNENELEEEKALEPTHHTMTNGEEAPAVNNGAMNGHGKPSEHPDHSPDLTKEHSQEHSEQDTNKNTHEITHHDLHLNGTDGVEALLPSVEDDIDEIEATTSAPVSYDHFSKKDFIHVLQTQVAEHDFKKADSVLREIKPLFDDIRNREKAEALARFTQGGGVAEDFDYKGDEDDALFDATFRLIREKKNTYFKNLEEQKTSNLKKKEEVLEKLRALAESEDTEHSLIAFKQLQHEWKAIGAVAPAQVKTLWANYGALVDRFYDQRSIYFELKELDRRKNLEMKIELCDKAEKLIKVERIQQAVRELNDLHNEFKHVGPVPKDEKEAVWQRFKAASDAVYARRDTYLTKLVGELQQNLAAKAVLGEELATFATFQSDRIKEWNQKTQDILALQKKWEAVGAIPRSKSKDINKKFWTSFKGFFNNKNQFFKKLDEGRDKNLQLKHDIIAKANELKESKDWDKTSNALKDLQTQWKEIGPVQEKYREKIFQEFKAACDHFFEQRRGQFEAADREQDEALKQKEAICAELEQIAATKTGTLDQLNELQSKFNALGFVPKKAVSSIRSRFNEAVTALLGTLNLSHNDKEKALLGIQINGLKNDPQGEVKIYHKEQVIRKRMTKMENDIAVLRNNLEFFGRSKNAEKMKEEFNAQITTATEELKELKNQLKMLKTAAS